MFEIIDVSAWPAVGDEQMGTKRKVWLEAPPGSAIPPGRWLFKYRIQYKTHSGGDDWSEKVAAEVAGLLRVRHATVQLATRDGEPGMIAWSLLEQPGAVLLTPGNRLLAEYEPTFPDTPDDYEHKDYTLDGTYRVLSRYGGVWDRFCGYLLLDALIGNTDRNPGNWAFLLYYYPATNLIDFRLCPSFDHASCLGYRETDAVRDRRFMTTDVGYTVANYASKAKSAFYAQGISRPIGTHEAFRQAAALRPLAGRYWLARLDRVPYSALTDIVARVPPAVMSESAKRFACEVLRANRNALLAVEPS